jgi:hypothetical protein
VAESDEVEKETHESHFCLDPSCFLSRAALDDLKQVLRILASESQVGKKIVILIPSLLKKGLESIVEGNVTSDLTQIFDDWLAFDTKEYKDYIIQSLSKDDGYKDLVKGFLDGQFVENIGQPIPTSEYVSDMVKIGDNSILKSFVQDKLGKLAGDVVFEMLAVSHKLKSKIIGFGHGVADLVKRIEGIGITIKIGYSNYKKELKRHANIKRVLNICILALSAEVAQNFVNEMKLTDGILPAPLSLTGLVVPAFMIADGGNGKTSASDLIENMEKLQKSKKEGNISNEEFQKIKDRLLEEM